MTTQYVQARPFTGAWKLEDNTVWNVPTEGPEVRLDIESQGYGWNLITKIAGLACTPDGKIFGVRTLSNKKEEGYNYHGKVSLAGKQYRAVTSARLFERPDGSLCDVGILYVGDYDGDAEQVNTLTKSMIPTNHFLSVWHGERCPDVQDADVRIGKPDLEPGDEYAHCSDTGRYTIERWHD